MLDERKRHILSALIKDFVTTAEPVGSKRLVERYALQISPATVRNELATLEELGYISQPHTSAGRVPTDLGYRFYVDQLSKVSTPMENDFAEVKEFYSRLNHEIGLLMRETSHLLSELTHCAALVYAPDIRKERIKHIDLVGLEGRGALIVVITSNGSVSKQVFDCPGVIEAETLKKLEAILNRSLADQPVDDISSANLIAAGLTGAESGLLKQVKAHIVESLAKKLTERVYYDGAAFLLARPEVSAVRRAHEVIGLLEQNYRLLDWLQAASDECEVIVSIGAENQLDLNGFSLVASGYEVHGQSVGVLGILGPTRMDYPKAISAVRHIAKNLGEVLEARPKTGLS
ncbi:MAG: heat-inducible transcriptional repressor HrcA [Actinomycetota bacterium]|nr:heat-inducible transcriptional repressor HrcA [Actinomycetota bacterium]